MASGGVPYKFRVKNPPPALVITDHTLAEMEQFFAASFRDSISTEGVVTRVPHGALKRTPSHQTSFPVGNGDATVDLS